MTPNEMLTRGEDVDILAEVGEVGPLIGQSGSTNGDSPCGSGGRIRTSIPVAVTSSNSKVTTSSKA